MGVIFCLWVLFCVMVDKDQGLGSTLVWGLHRVWSEDSVVACMDDIHFKTIEKQYSMRVS